MDDRISDALALAGRGRGVITDLMEDLFGQIPEQCRN